MCITIDINFFRSHIFLTIKYPLLVLIISSICCQRKDAEWMGVNYVLFCGEITISCSSDGLWVCPSSNHGSTVASWFEWVTPRFRCSRMLILQSRFPTSRILFGVLIIIHADVFRSLSYYSVFSHVRPNVPMKYLCMQLEEWWETNNIIQGLLIIYFIFEKVFMFYI